MSSRKFLLWFSIISVFIILLICITNYIVDPFMQYRVKDGKYIINPRFVNPGLLKNYDYDLLLIGSSMVQLLDMDLLRKKIPSKPLKAASGDMNIKEIELIYSLAKKEEVKTFIINLDLHKFFLEEVDIRYPEYLYKSSLINNLRYLLSYETNRFTPIDIIVSEYLTKEENISPKLYNRTKIDKIGDFSLDLIFSSYNVKQDFCRRYRPDTTGIYSRMTSRFDQFFSRMQFEEYRDKEFILFLPPYSVVYWHAAKIDGYYNEMIDFLYYILEKSDSYDNIRIVCMYDSDFITEVNTYADMVHFSPIRVESITNIIAEESVALTLKNIDSNINKLDSLVTHFEVEYADWLICD